MKLEWLVTNVTASGSPDRVERTILEVILAEHFFANLGRICGREAILWCRNPLLSPNNFTYGQLLKTEWLVAYVTPVSSPAKAEREFFKVDFGLFWKNKPPFWSWSHFVILSVCPGLITFLYFHFLCLNWCVIARYCLFGVN